MGWHAVLTTPGVVAPSPTYAYAEDRKRVFGGRGGIDLAICVSAIALEFLAPYSRIVDIRELGIGIKTKETEFTSDFYLRTAFPSVI